VTALTDLTGRVIEQYWYSPYGQLEAHVAAHPFDFDDDGDVDAQDIAAGTSGGTCWGDYDGAAATANASTPTAIATSMWMTTRSSTTTWPPGTAKPPCNASPRPATAGAETSSHTKDCRSTGAYKNWRRDSSYQKLRAAAVCAGGTINGLGTHLIVGFNGKSLHQTARQALLTKDLVGSKRGCRSLLSCRFLSIMISYDDGV
jgi:hypothetical protein